MSWRDRLLPLMAGTIMVLAAFFMLGSLAQFYYLQWSHEHFMPPAPKLAATDLALASTTDAGIVRLRLLASLEEQALLRRYHQLNTALTARTWSQYLGFLTGMILAIVGATFVLGGIRATGTEMGVQASSTSLSLKAHSPGLVMAALGVLLMLTTIVTHHPIEVVDRSVYLTSGLLDEPPLGRDVARPVLAAPR